MRLFLESYSNLPRATKTLVAACAAGYLINMVFGSSAAGLLGLVPYAVVHRFWLWQPVTYIFLHGGLLHAAFNIFMLWMFGRIIEEQWGSREFYKYFFITGIGAGLFDAALTPNSPIPVIGASGAIFGLLAAFALMFPEAEVYMYFIFPVKAWQMAVILGVMELAASFDSARTGIANLAHLGGLAVGYVYLRWYPRFALEAKSFFTPRHAERGFAEPGDSEIDRILDKISEKGTAALSEKEKEILRSAGRR